MTKLSLIIVTLGLATGCGTDKKSDTPAATTPTTAVTWAQAQVVINKSCATANCHVTGGKGIGNYAGISEANFRATDSKARIQDAGNPMPQVNSAEAKAFSDADKTTLLNFLNNK